MSRRALNKNNQKQTFGAFQLTVRNIAAIVSTLVWTAGFFLAFVIPGGSPYLWLPDTLLLAGFVPLLLVWRPIWPWFVFGVCNVVIGFVLAVAQYLPDADLPRDLPKVRQHLAEFHVPLIWILFGIGSLAYGVLSLIGSWWRRFCSKNNRN